MKNLYKILKINNTATDEEIISAFRKQAKLNHPDISDQSNANEIIQGIYEAREILLDSNKRKQYDLLLVLIKSGGVTSVIYPTFCI